MLKKNVDTSKSGSYTVKYIAKDSSGNEQTIELLVTVKEKVIVQQVAPSKKQTSSSSAKQPSANKKPSSSKKPASGGSSSSSNGGSDKPLNGIYDGDWHYMGSAGGRDFYESDWIPLE